MATTETAARLPLGAVTVYRLVSGTTDILARVRRSMEVRRTVRLLGELDDARLHDLGLTRGAIADFAECGHF